MRVRRRPVPAVTGAVGAAVLLLAVSACSNSESAVQKNPRDGTSTAPADAVQQVLIKSGPDLRFHPSTIVVHPGKVRIVLQNTAPSGQGAPHDLQVDKDHDADVPMVAAGQERSMMFTAPAPGRYTFICTFHVAQGQTGTLVVQK